MKDEDILEFFTFLPDQLLQNIEDAYYHTQPSTQNPPPPNSTFPLNYHIFTQYVLKHCFTFPSTFNFDRKLTTLICHTQLQNIINDIVLINDELNYLILEKNKINNNIVFLKYKINKYETLLKDINTVNNSLEAISKMEERIELVDGMYERMCGMGCEQNGSGIGVLMDNDVYRNEVEVNERNELVERYSVNCMDDIIAKHKKQ